MQSNGKAKRRERMSGLIQNMVTESGGNPACNRENQGYCASALYQKTGAITADPWEALGGEILKHAVNEYRGLKEAGIILQDGSIIQDWPQEDCLSNGYPSQQNKRVVGYRHKPEVKELLFFLKPESMERFGYEESFIERFQVQLAAI